MFTRILITWEYRQGMMLESSYRCPSCPRVFREASANGGVPNHLDPVLGTPCPGPARLPERPMEAIEAARPDPRQDSWPRWDRYHLNTHRPRPGAKRREA